MMLPIILIENNFLHGFSLLIFSAGKLQLINYTNGIIIIKSIYKNWLSVKFVCFNYNKLTELNWIKLYIIIHLKHWKLVTNAHLPSLRSSTILLMSNVWDVNGAAMDASACERDRPTLASLRAKQSFAPSPHIPTIELVQDRRDDTSRDLCSGFILAYTLSLLKIWLKTEGSIKFWSLR